jgi:hypothetical protein
MRYELRAMSYDRSHDFFYSQLKAHSSQLFPGICNLMSDTSFYSQPKTIHMKQLFVAFALLISISSIGQWSWKRIEGNGNIKKETRSISGYTAISSSGAWDVMVAYGESNSIEVEGDENLLEYIETKVEKGRLTISSKNVNLHSKHKITIYVSLTKLTGVNLSGSGDIIGEGKFSNDGQTEFKTSGSGGIKLTFGKVKDAYVRVSGSGRIRLTGSADAIEMSISGSGSADCGDVITDDATIRISGSGNGQVYANRSVSASISGSGNASYKGTASEIKKHISGSGRFGKG